jgi:hypothetical protein
VERDTGEVVESRHGGDRRAGELAAGGDQDVGAVRAVVAERHLPLPDGLVPAGGGHLRAEPDAPEDSGAPGDVLQVVADLRLGRIAARPVGLGCEGEGVERGGDVAGRTGIGVGRPDAAHAIGALEHRHVVALPQEACGHADAAEPRADDGDGEMLTQG